MSKHHAGRHRWNVLLGRRAGLGGEFLRRVADLLQVARRDDDEVVRHDVRVLEHELDRLAGLHDEPLLVEAHLVEQRADADDADADLAQFLSRRLRLGRREQPRERLAELHHVERHGRGPLGHRQRADELHHRVEVRLGIVLRPVASGDAEQRLHRGGAVGVGGEELGDGLERVGLLAADAGEREHRRLADDPFGRRPRRPRTRPSPSGVGFFTDWKTVFLSASSTRRVKLLSRVAEVAVGAVPDDDLARSGPRGRDRPPTTGRRCPPAVCVWPPSA